MVAHHIHDALAQVQKMRELILEKRKFRGYSGKARIACGFVALTAAAIMASDLVPADAYYHLLGWGIVLAIGIGLNYSALAYWFLFDREVRRNPIMLKPAIDALPALGVGAVFTAVLIFLGHEYLLPGMWMCLYGVAQVAYRQTLPPGIYLVGIGYILCGTYCLLALTYPHLAMPFTNPWPMGLVFFLGEMAGGLLLILYRVNTEPGDQHDDT